MSFILIKRNTWYVHDNHEKQCCIYIYFYFNWENHVKVCSSSSFWFYEMTWPHTPKFLCAPSKLLGLWGRTFIIVAKVVIVINMKRNKLTKLSKCDSYTIEWLYKSIAWLLGLLVLHARTDRNARAVHLEVPQSTYYRYI